MKLPWRKKKLKYTLMGDAPKCQTEFIEMISKCGHKLKLVSDGNYHVILFFCTVVSRAGTDIEAALQKIRSNNLPENTPIILVVLHHTFDPDRIVPDSKRAVNLQNMLTVDCLFHEDKGLLDCSSNNKTIKEIAEWLKKTKPRKNKKNKNKTKTK